MTLLDLATCSYRAFTSELGVGVSTSVGKPRGWHGNRERGVASKPYLNSVAPYGIFNHKPAYDEPTFRRLYGERLDDKASEIDESLRLLGQLHAGQRLVILCWCSVTHLDDFCHRLMFRSWAQDRYGISIPELTLQDTP